MADLLPFFQALGPAGAILAILAYFVKGLAPLAREAVAHLGRIADAMQKTAMQVQALDHKADRTLAELGEVSEDLAGVYALMRQERPSKRRTLGAAGD